MCLRVFSLKEQIMSLNQTIQNFTVKFDLNPGVINNSTGTIKFSNDVAFSGVTHYQEFKGTYTPNNDILNLLTALPSSQAPNFIIISCSGRIDITMQTSAGTNIAALPVYKTAVLLLPVGTSDQIYNLYIDGRTNNPQITFDPDPMPQNVAVDYWIIMGQATLT